MTNYIERYWRDATPEDAIKEPPMVARFLKDNSDWLFGKLVGCWRDYLWGGSKFVNEFGASYKTCQVYDAPDPGEGWRLVDVETETPQEGDEFFATSSKVWCFCNEQTRRVGYARNAIIRRRIEQPKPKYEPFRWEDREQLRGRWIVDSTGDHEYTSDDFLNDDGVLYICGHPAEYFLNWKFMDTGEPVGRRVEQ